MILEVGRSCQNKDAQARRRKSRREEWSTQTAPAEMLPQYRSSDRVLDEHWEPVALAFDGFLTDLLPRI
jgi:hypothetical protein